MKKRLLSILLALALLCAVLPAAALRASAATSGTCGDNLTWTFDSDTGTLTITGSGEMAAYTQFVSPAPWTDLKQSIKTVTIDSGVTSIGDWAFRDCYELTSVSLPSSLSVIGQFAFSGCSHLTAVSIPASVNDIRFHAFYLCSMLTNITVASGNKNYSSDSYGVLFNKAKTNLMQCPGGFQGSYTIPSTVTSIDEEAFCGCIGLTAVTIPSSVTDILYGAFIGCISLTSVAIPKNVSFIADYVFAGCSSLTKITVDSGNTFYCSDNKGVLFNKNKTELIYCPGAFQGSYTIPCTVTTIVNSAFSGCRALTAVTIPTGVTTIGNRAFHECFSLTALTIPGSVTTIQENAFDSCFALTAVTITDGVTSIGNEAFSCCFNLTDVFISESVTSFGTDIFIICDPDLVIYGIAGSTAETYANENNIPFVAVSVPKITTQPKSVTVAVGEKATFTVAATGGVLSYQWQYRRAGETSWANYSGKTEATLTVKGGSNNNGCQYRCVVSNPLGKKNSAAATLTVTSVAKPVITTQPKSVSMALGECMTFSCAATGEGTLRYQWQYKRSGAASWSDWSGKTDPILNVTAGSNNNGCQYRCAVTNAGGTTYTDAATLTITSTHECPGAAFTDMPAQGTIEHTAIDWAVRAGVTNGTSSTSFSPSKTVTRGQVVTFLWRACGCPEPKSTQNPFTDVKTSDYFYKAVLWAVEQGITNGTSATKFSPNKTCTRAHILTFLYRQQGSPAVGSVTVPYTDVKAGEFYEKPMKWAYSNGIDRGVTSTTFCPNADCTRVSTVVFLYRAITGQGRLK